MPILQTLQGPNAQPIADAVRDIQAKKAALATAADPQKAAGEILELEQALLDQADAGE